MQIRLAGDRAVLVEYGEVRLAARASAPRADVRADDARHLLPLPRACAPEVRAPSHVRRGRLSADMCERV